MKKDGNDSKVEISAGSATRITYSDSALHALSLSPLAQRRPVGMPSIPNATTTAPNYLRGQRASNVVRVLNDATMDDMMAYIAERGRIQERGIRRNSMTL